MKSRQSAGRSPGLDEAAAGQNREGCNTFKTKRISAAQAFN
jgi:hypothetical protein